MVIVTFMVLGNLRISRPACQVLVLSVDISVRTHLITVLRGERHSREVCLRSQATALGNKDFSQSKHLGQDFP